MPTKDAQLCKAILDSGLKTNLVNSCLSNAVLTDADGLSPEQLQEIKKYYRTQRAAGKQLLASLSGAPADPEGD